MPNLLAHAYLPAGGAAVGDLIIASLVGMAAASLVVALGIAHRVGGRTRLLDAAGSLASRTTGGMPREAALPLVIAVASLLLAAFGYYVDVATHIDEGRDAGPFGTPAHYPILMGLGGLALAGSLGVILGTDPTRTSAFRITDEWAAPSGSVFLLLCGAFGLLGFPLDDTWHRIFGQDVTAWGPTHIIMIGAAMLAPIACWMLVAHAREVRFTSAAAKGVRDERRSTRGEWFFEALLGGALLTSLSALNAEFDFGVPQFRLLCHPVLIAVVAAFVLVLVRARLGRGAALHAAIGFCAIRGAISLTVIATGHTMPHFQTYLGEALLVELVALAIGTASRTRFAVVSGALVGTLGVLTEWAWTHAWMPLPWPASMMLTAIAFTLPAAVAAALLAAWVLERIETPDAMPGAPEVAPQLRPRGHVPGPVAIGALLVAIVCVGYPVRMSSADVSAMVTTVRAADGETFTMQARIEPAYLADDADWLYITAWQGGGLVTDRLERVSRGVYRTTKDIPFGGNWKAILRLHHGSAISALPLSLPADPAIPAPAVELRERFTREFQSDASVLRREEKPGLETMRRIGYALLLAIVVTWLAGCVAALQRLRRGPEPAGVAGAAGAPAPRTLMTSLPFARRRSTRTRRISR